ncbi:UTP--glucose-1-phosphate uridylyltransferase [Desulfocurvibacter africanus]|uniref:UTP--glucose-1-phosphate uridylyltransferase n=1 Tax=Desulfocurvibacter africanus subsp. africanus str. Walvis Bay TaxID=690850 RepID=F3YWC0_DESAF|nr:UTP--glucose-1-phosphate uridylyltransferase [Desulfocurvibacter africanus]EGJ49223.1 UTP--glucose-1-phosphate uridylyltransferase [Desulfocurvibacter africanus subsp. africanus str. Walvis Bay]
MRKSPLLQQVFDYRALPESDRFKQFALKMEAHNLPPIVINIFKYYYSLLLSGSQGKMAEADITPISPDDLKDYLELDAYEAAGRKALPKVAIIKLNGGLGTSMGLETAKSLLAIKAETCFLDVIIEQVERLRERYDIPVPLTLMNSFHTHSDSMLAIEGFDNGRTRVPLAFIQHMYPKIMRDTFLPARWPKNPELEWNPPGHGDLYTAMVTSKTLKRLEESGFEYAFISNSDNLGAVMDLKILGYMASEDLPFLMEVAQRTPADKKGGHLCKVKESGRLALREVAQCPDEELAEFQNIEKYAFFNTNSIWINLKVLEKVFAYHGMMPLDLIANHKTLDPRDPDSPPVIQVETAMGSAISAFHTAAAVRVPRTRFAPVKTSNDLLNVMSDNFILSTDYEIVPNPERNRSPVLVDLDPTFYKKVDDFQDRFPEGVPSLLNCTTFTVRGDVRFKGGVACRGNVLVENRTGHQVVVGPEDLAEENAQLVLE